MVYGNKGILSYLPYPLYSLKTTIYSLKVNLLATNILWKNQVSVCEP